MDQRRSPELAELKDRLEADPYSMALLQEQVNEIEKKQLEETELEATSDEEPPEASEMGNEEFEEMAALWQEQMDERSNPQVG